MQSKRASTRWRKTARSDRRCRITRIYAMTPASARPRSRIKVEGYRHGPVATLMKVMASYRELRRTGGRRFIQAPKQGRQIQQPAPHHINDFALFLQFAIARNQRRAHADATIAIENTRPEDDIGDSGFI